MQAPSYLGKKQPSIHMVQNGFDPSNNSSIPRLSCPDVPTKYQHLIGIPISISSLTCVVVCRPLSNTGHMMTILLLNLQQVQSLAFL